ncbi:MAG: hypothetical protein QOG03_484 [Actinomycetota bacterium]|jgi:hypothetical protein|nr:hypothetical protein [Actinomycetota bacterium]
MPKTSKATTSQKVEVEGYQGNIENFDGGYTVAFETYTADADMSALFAGLPDDQCQCPHWGYVVKGELTYKTKAGDETFVTGDAYYVGPGHTPVLTAGTEVIEFSPTADMEKTMEVVMKNMGSAG